MKKAQSSDDINGERLLDARENKPLISVIVAVYNIEEYVERCIESIIKQTYSELQIILVDDGSTDGSGGICDEYGQKDSRITVIHKVNGGLSDARNAGLKIASGEYIGYVDGDDWIESDMYETMIDELLIRDAELACCRYKNVYRDRTEDDSSEDVLVLSPLEMLDIYINEHPKYRIYNSVWSKLYKASLVKDLTFPKGHNSEDIMYTTTAMCRMKKGVYIDRALYNYVIDREGSIMNDKSGKRMLEDEIPFWRRHIEIIREYGYDDMAGQAAYRFYRRLLYYYTLLVPVKKNRNYARMLAEEVRKDRDIIDELYKEDFVKKGDIKRMRMFLRCPYSYYLTDLIYNKTIIPIRLMYRKKRNV